MKAGMVARIRVNTKDCMAIVDVARMAGISTDNVSFASLVSTVLGALLEGQRVSGNIPRRAGFEYLEMMRPYIGGKTMQNRGKILEALSAVTPIVREEIVEGAGEMDMESLQREFSELHERREVGELSVAEEKRYILLNKMLFS